MFIRAYLRASTEDQDASRARHDLEAFAQQHGHKVATSYIENRSGASLQRPELFQLLADSHRGDVLLVEEVDRLSRLNEADWKKLRQVIGDKGIKVVALDLPTSYMFMRSDEAGDAFTGRMLDAINGMLLDMLAAIARKDYEDRRRRQAQGVAKAKAQGAYKGRAVNADLHRRIRACLDQGMTVRQTADTVGCNPSTVQRVKGQVPTTA